MESLSESVELDMEESNELAFKIKVEGAASSPAKVRLVCENGDMSYMFNGHGTGEDGVVQFVIPKMSDKLKEGEYLAKVEVLIENRYFSPVQFNINFKKAMKVMAEAVKIVPRAASTPTMTVTAKPVVIVKPKAEPKPIVVAEAPVVQKASTLKETYDSKKTSSKPVIDEQSIRAIAREFIRSTRSK